MYIMSKRDKIVLALQQVDNIEKIFEDLDYSDYLVSKCYKLKYELQRQLSLMNASDGEIFDR
jgi:hypothetical protein